MRKQTITRRRFIQGSIASGAALSLLPTGRVLGANGRVNVAVLGTGGMGGGHVNGFDGMANASVIAVSDPDLHRMDQKTAKLKHPVVKHQDFRKVLAMKEVDAVVIATPNHWHAPMAIMAMAAGKHVYVQKPVSHSIWEGRMMVNAARKYNKLCQAGTQHRSCPAVLECAADIQAGKYGKVEWIHCSKLGSRKSIGKVNKPTPVPDYIDYNLWAGPAPMTPVMRRSFHYDWHWQWNWGDGEMGNWGVHYIDDLRHYLGWDDIPTSVISAGNRYAWNDDGQTPNMHIALMEHKGVKIVVDIRNLPDLKLDAEDKSAGGKSGAAYRCDTGFVNDEGKPVISGSRSGNLIKCENGYIRIARGGGASYDPNGKRIKQYKGNGGRGHDKNFINAVISGKRSDLKCEIEIGHQSTAMCHQANIAWRVGHEASVDQVKSAMKEHGDAMNTLNSILKQLDRNHVDLKKTPLVLGPKLTYDNKTERFTGSNAAAGNKYIKNNSRKGFDVPWS